jgi:hypothetical protein
MSNDTQTRFARSLPPMGAAMADIAIAAYQRTFALNASMLEHWLANGANQSQQAMHDPAQPMAWQSPFTQSSTYEQLWRYQTGMMAIVQNATAAMANLITAQMRGADREVETISKAVHHDVAEAAASAAAAAGSAMSNGLSAVSRMAEMTTQAGNAAGAKVQERVEQAAKAAFNGGGGRNARAAGGRNARHH